MASTDPEIKDGFTLPVWMKSKPTKDFEPFAASPPAPEDSFFFIRYPKSDLLNTKKVDEPPKIKLEQAIPNFQNPSTDGKEVRGANYNFKEKDWSKHTKPCQDVLHSFAPVTVVDQATQKPKPAGTDDGFKGEGAACGNSIVKVAQQMVLSTGGGRGFTVASPEEDAVPPTPDQYHRMAARRGSKSLPTTPAHSPPGSPNARRRNPHRYFTSPFEPVGDGSNRSWLTMALLGFKKDLAGSSSTLAEEDDADLRIDNRLQSNVSLAQSVESLGPAPKGREPTTLRNDAPAQTTTPKPKPHAFRPKPSELREMNFWSPTSM